MVENQNGTMLVGEPMGLFMAQDIGRLEDITDYSLAVAGAEFNVAVGLARLQHDVAYLTKLGIDPIGRRIFRLLGENNIHNESVLFTDTHTTGFMMKSMVTTGDPDIYYYRKGTASSTFCAEDLDRVELTGYSHLHLTGIFPALSGTTFGATLALILRAKREGLSISFDPNLRPQLWPSQERMVATVNEIAKAADIILPGQSEGEILMGSRKPEEIAEYYLSAGAKAIAVKVGAQGAYVATQTENRYVDGFSVDRVVDTVGAGDGFAVGFIAALQEGKDYFEAAKWGNAVGAIQVTHRGDNEGLPTREQLASFMKESSL